MAVYKGFSFKNWEHSKSFIMTDVELVAQDLKNHIFTRLGDRVNMRGYGTIIPDILFEPFDNNTIAIVNEHVRAVINADPRVVLRSEDDFETLSDFDKRVLVVAARLFYVELDLTNVLYINLQFES